MINRMSAAEYQKQVAKPARDASLDDDALIEQLRGKTKQGKKKQSQYMVRTGVSVFEGGKKVKEINDEWQPVKKKKQRKPRNNEEDQITMQVTEYLEVLKSTGKVIAFSHIPNSTFTRSWSVKRRNTAMGVRAGVPDMLIVFKDKVLFLELKRVKGGVLSPYQKEWIKAINAVEEPALDSSHRYVIARVASGFDEAQAVIDECL